jgi:FkbM family methyltransferase
MSGQIFKRTIKAGMRKLGYDIRRMAKGTQRPLGQDPFSDMQRFISAEHSPLIFDVGANVGQTIELCAAHFKAPVIHAFEPGSEPYGTLRQRYAHRHDIQLNNFALGRESGLHRYFENTESSAMNSLHAPGPECYAGSTRYCDVKAEREVRVRTLDEYCAEHAIGRIDILKSDTQGHELEVLEGASTMLRQRAIGMVFVEIIFHAMYEDMARPDQIMALLFDHGFELVSFYPMYYFENRKASWADALFIQPDYVAHP